MAPKPKVHTVGSTIETTLIFAPKAVVEDLAEQKRKTKKRTSSANGTLGELIGTAVEEKHLDRKAFSLACQLDGLDDERLHITWPNLLAYAEFLGIPKRVQEQEKAFLFETAAAPKEDDKAADGKGAGGARTGASVTQIGEAARRVAEAAGADK